MLLLQSRSLACAFVAVIAHLQPGAAKYLLQKDYSGLNFFSNFKFVTVWICIPTTTFGSIANEMNPQDNDPTHGFVDYVNEAEARRLGMIWETDGLVYIGVDHTNVVTPWCGRRGRPSVRLESKAFYTHGLIIGSFWHMPGGDCGTWPAFWTYGPNWPNSGEIDIIEGVHKQPWNQMALHTSANCTVAGTQSGTRLHDACGPETPDNAGCGVQSNSPNSFGTAFNANRGGVYATQWTSTGIQIWFFPRDSIPSDITAGKPKPDTWGVASGNFSSPCNFDAHFKDQTITLNVAFCGDWAGNVWAQSGCSAPQWACCNEYVATNPGAFINTFWLIESIKVYQEVSGSWESDSPSGDPVLHTQL